MYQGKILIVDDEPDFIETAQQILKQEGYKVGKAFGGIEGLKKAWQYNLILLDYRMPGMTGYDVLHRMKQSKIKVPVILISGFEIPGELKEDIISKFPNTMIMSKVHIEKLPGEVKKHLVEKIKKLDEFRLFLQEIHSSGVFVMSDFKNTKSKITVVFKRHENIGICPKCSKGCKASSFKKRKVRDLDIIKPCYFEFEQAEIKCPCGYRGVEKIDFVNKNSRYSKRFEAHIVKLLGVVDISYVASVCKINKKDAERIESRYYMSFCSKI